MLCQHLETFATHYGGSRSENVRGAEVTLSRGVNLLLQLVNGKDRFLFFASAAA
jgi:hypothetical protein